MAAVRSEQRSGAYTFVHGAYVAAHRRSYVYDGIWNGGRKKSFLIKFCFHQLSECVFVLKNCYKLCRHSRRDPKYSLFYVSMSFHLRSFFYALSIYAGPSFHLTFTFRFFFFFCCCSIKRDRKKNTDK